MCRCGRRLDLESVRRRETLLRASWKWENIFMWFARSFPSRPRTIACLLGVLALTMLLASAMGAAPRAATAPARAARPAAPVAPRCEICGQAVSGRFFQAGGHTYCKTCCDRYPKCAACGLPVVKGKFRSLGRAVCESCGERAGVCANCGDVLLGHYFVPPQPVDGVRGFCETCSKTKPKCILCNLPFPGMTTVDGQLACPTCLKKAIRCSTCSQPILGRYFSIEFQPGQFCRKCYEERPHCSFCGRPFLDDPNSGARDLPDGRRSCAMCAATAVQSTGEALDLLADTVRSLEQDLGMRVREPYDFVLVDNRVMAFLTRHLPGTGTVRQGDKAVHAIQGAPSDLSARASGEHAVASTLQELGIFNSRMTSESPRMTIALLSELPRAAFLETVAHEYAHLWLFTRNPDFHDMELNEGFAQWVAAKWLAKRQMGTALARLEARRDHPYGTGYQAIRAIESSGGADAVMVRVLGRPLEKISADLPAGNLPQDRTGKSLLAPLGDVLPASLLDGSYGFLRQAAVVNPSALRQRPSRLAPVATGATTAPGASGAATAAATGAAPPRP